MSILIKGMDMPTEGTVIAIYKLNGQFYASVHGTELCPLVPVPTPHGDLIDVSMLKEQLKRPVTMTADRAKNLWEGWHECTIAVSAVIDAAPTIIEAEEED